MSKTTSPVESDPASVPAETSDVPAGTPSEKDPSEQAAPDPTRYGDWEKNGRCIDFRTFALALVASVQDSGRVWRGHQRFHTG